MQQTIAAKRTAKKAKRARHQPSIRKWVTDSFLADYFDVDRTTIWRWAKKGLIPPPEKFGENTTRFNFEAVQASETESA